MTHWALPKESETNKMQCPYCGIPKVSETQFTGKYKCHECNKLFTLRQIYDKIESANLAYYLANKKLFDKRKGEAR